MPWTAKDAYRKSHKASTLAAQRQWAHVANSELDLTGDDARAVRAANSVVAKRKLGSVVSGRRK